MSEEDVQTRIEEREVEPGSPDQTEENGGESQEERQRRKKREAAARHRERQKAAKQESGTGGATKQRKSGSGAKGSIDTERWEADLALQGVSMVTMQQLGVQTNPPDEKGRDHLAYLIRRLMSKGPLSRVQSVLRTTYDSGRPGKSILGDVAGFGASMYAANRGLVMAMVNTYVNRNQPEEAPRVPSKYEMEEALETELSDEQYMQALRQNGFV